MNWLIKFHYLKSFTWTYYENIVSAFRFSFWFFISHFNFTNSFFKIIFAIAFEFVYTLYSTSSIVYRIFDIINNYILSHRCFDQTFFKKNSFDSNHLRNILETLNLKQKQITTLSLLTITILSWQMLMTIQLWQTFITLSLASIAMFATLLLLSITILLLSLSICFYFDEIVSTFLLSSSIYFHFDEII